MLNWFLSVAYFVVTLQVSGLEDLVLWRVGGSSGLKEGRLSGSTCAKMVKKEKKPGPTLSGEDDGDTAILTVEDVDEKIAVLRRGAPPPALSSEDFRDRFGLNATGINPHKNRDTAEILHTDLTSVFGAHRGKSGFWFGDVKNSKVKSAIARLYPIVYQKPHVIKTKLIGKEFAIGIVADVVKGLDVDWASFAHATNRNQRSAWQKKMKAALEMKASLTDRKLSEILEEEDFGTLMLGDVVVKGEAPQLGCRGADSVTPRESSSWIEKKKQESLDLERLVQLELQAVKMDAEVSSKEKQRLDSKVEGISCMLENMKATCTDFKTKCDDCKDEAELKEMKATLAFYEATLSKTEGEYNSILAEQGRQGDVQQKLVRREAFLIGQQSMLAKQLRELRGGRSGLALHPHPMCNSIGQEEWDCDYLKLCNCVLCESPFTYNDIVVCSCRHLYHPWCAVSWFSSSSRCVDKSCSHVHPDWYKSFGFREQPVVLEEKADALNCEELRNVALSERTAAAKRSGATIGKVPMSPCFSYGLAILSHIFFPTLNMIMIY